MQKNALKSEKPYKFAARLIMPAGTRQENPQAALSPRSAFLCPAKTRYGNDPAYPS
jgi:hypothetical protein